MPLFLGDLLGGLGFGGQVGVALSAGFIVWYLFKALRIGRKAGGFVESLVKYGMAIATFVAVGIYFGWVTPGLLLNDLLAGGRWLVGAGWDLVTWAIDWLRGVL